MEATKSHVLAKVQAERRGLEINLFNLAGEEFDRPGVVGDWSIKDLLANLFEWERLFLHWHDQTLRGIEPQVPCPGISWKDREILNRQIYLKYRNRDPEWVLNKFRATHARFHSFVDRFMSQLYRLSLWDTQILKFSCFHSLLLTMDRNRRIKSDYRPDICSFNERETQQILHKSLTAA